VPPDVLLNFRGMSIQNSENGEPNVPLLKASTEAPFPLQLESN
jgi:hypothetical protein